MPYWYQTGPYRVIIVPLLGGREALPGGNMADASSANAPSQRDLNAVPYVPSTQYRMMHRKAISMYIILFNIYICIFTIYVCSTLYTRPINI